MTISKIMLTQEQAQAIQFQLRHGDIAGLLNLHAEKLKLKWSHPHNAPLNDLSQTDLARALLIGYDVEPEEFKVGDWVVNSTHYSIDFVFQIEHEDLEDSVDTSHLRYATPEEIKAEKERQLWAKIGREVGFFVRGDVGIHSIGKVHCNQDYIKEMHSNGELKGFYPAESFISFEDGDDE